MRGREVKLILLVVAVVILTAAAAYSDTDVKTTVDLTQVGMGARPIGLGGAYIGIADDASAIFTNPAGLGIQNKMSFVSMSTQLLTVVDYQLAGVTYPTSFGTFGIGYVGASSPAGNYSYIVGTTEVFEGEMNYTNQMLILSYGTDLSSTMSDLVYGESGQVNSFAVGANIKLAQQGFGGADKKAPSATGFAVDLGAIYAPNKVLTFGTTLTNASGSMNWTSGENERMAEALKVGVAYKALDYLTLALDTNMGSNNSDMHLGAEWQVISMLALRAGMETRAQSIDDETIASLPTYTVGAGVMLLGFRFDYAYKQDPTFNEYSTHYFSFSWFGAEEPKQTNTGNEILAGKKTEPTETVDYEKLMEEYRSK